MSPSTHARQAARFEQLHRAGQPLLMPNPWDPGSARLLAWLGFQALATTSSGAAGLAGFSIEDHTGRVDDPIYAREDAAASGSIAARAAFAREAS